ncbi:MAG TPA: L-threonylcarbamoyladenylate synthase [Patescibacteria group bacterium]|nr:L-threonylcarbamoyladenylate synthase [Patescibacteria group bacterium]
MKFQTQIFNAQADFTSSIALGAELLKKGELVSFPTETVYGLGARIFEEAAVLKIFAAKGRPNDNPLIAHISAISDIEKIAVEIPDAFLKLAEAFFPGPLAVVVKKHPRVPAAVSAGLDTIAIRMPDHDVALALISATGEPLVAPSANISGRPSPTIAQHVLEDMAGKIPAILDGGACRVGIESTVISILGKTPIILRPGTITNEEIEDVLKTKIEVVSSFTTNERVASPGMKYRHYAPKAKVLLFKNGAEAEMFLKENDLLKTRILSNSFKNARPLLAETLYAEFRDADKASIEQIVIILDDNTEQKLGLMNRILKAAE